MKETNDTGKPKAEEPKTYQYSWLGKLFFWYLNQSMYLANSRCAEGRSLAKNDLIKMDPADDPDVTRKTFKKAFDETGSLVKAMFRVWGCSFWSSVLQLLIASLLQYAGPITLNMLLTFYFDKSQPQQNGYLIATVLFVLLLIRTFFFNHGQDNIYYDITLNYSSFYGSIYTKTLNIIESVKGAIGAGRILNFISTDTTFVSEVLSMLHNLWMAPLNIIISIYLLYREVEWCAFVGVGLILIFGLLQILVMGAFIRNRMANQAETDKRTKLLQEFLEGIRIIKYYAWEKFVHQKIGEVRDNELAQVRYGLIMRTLHEFIMNTIPIATMLVVFVIYSTSIGDLTVAKVFTVISIFAILRPPLFTFITSIILVAQAKASVERLTIFFNIVDEFEKYVESPETLKNGEIEIENASFVWETKKSKELTKKFCEMIDSRMGGRPRPETYKVNNETPSSQGQTESVTLSNINLKINSGEIYAVVGLVGSGKSSLVNAIIGEMFKLAGSAKVKGTVAYISQNAWIVNGTLRDNIVMDKLFDKVKYKRVIRVCELREDIKTFPGKDRIEIGSKGINLSGGQKQRISIARALYADADIYIIDDCLSALDAHVGRAIFNKVIIGALANKTRILVTHAIHFIKGMEHILVMKGGEIIARGNYDVLAVECSEFKDLTQVAMMQQDKEEIAKEKRKESLNEPIESESEKEDPAKKPLTGEKLVALESQEVGGVKLSNYLLLFVYSGVFLGVTVILLYVLIQVSMILSDWWVGVWGSDQYNKSNGYYIGIYAAISAGQTLGVLIRGFVYMKFILTLAKGTQMRLVWSILRAPLRWFDQTPIGRIINRACKDQATIDTDIVWLLQGCLRFVLQVAGSLILIGSVTPYFFIELFVIIVLYVYYYRFSIQASRDCRRIESVAKSPIFAQFGETLDGLTSLRAYKYESMMQKKMLASITTSNEAYFMTARCARWLNLRVDILAAFAVAGAYYFAVVSREYGVIEGSLIGLSISQSLAIVNYVGLMLMMLGMLDIKMNAVERVIEYVEKTPAEKEFEEPKPKDSQWPIEGGVKLNKVYFRYRDELDNVIHGITLEVKPREKIGIAGRTGSGKSTITLGLLRIIEPYNMPGEPTEGRITIDGQDIEKIGLHVLRQKIAIIPQDAILFSGTVRTNLDPFRERCEKHDSEILEVLHKVKLLGAIYQKTLSNDQHLPININGIAPYELTKEEKEKIVECEVQEKGGNFSMGERQLLCIARALLRKPKILLMDEATASIDENTDRLIQLMIRTEFKEATVITIAHRVNTIIDSDRIAVLHEGKLIEYDTPKALLMKSDGSFAEMVRRQGEKFYQEMLKVATDKQTSQ